MRSIRLLIAFCAVSLLIPAGARAALPAINVAGAPTRGVVADALSTGAKQVRMFVFWADFEPDAATQYPPSDHPVTGVENNVKNLSDVFDAAIRQINAQGAEPIFVVVGAPRWANASADRNVPPRDPATYAQFFSQFVAHNAAVGRVAAYEVWNEPDDDSSWHAPVDPVRYAALLKASYAAAKPRAQGAAILAGPLTGSNFPFLEAMYDAGAKGFFDGVAVHTDFACLVRPPSDFYREDGRISRYRFLAYRELRASMAARGDAKPIWVTELGWSSTGGRPDSCQRGAFAGQKPDGVTEQAQAEYLTAAYGCLANDPDVVSAGWFTMRDARGEVPDELDHYGLVRADGTPKPSLAAFRLVVATGGGPALACGDFAPPAIRVLAPLPGQPFVGRLDVRVVAADAGVGVSRVTLRYDRGAKIRAFGRRDGLQDDAVLGLTPWYGSSALALGPHTVEVTAIDHNGNEARVEVPVVKVDPATVPAFIAPAFRVGTRVRCSRRRCRIRGGVSRALGGPPLSGRLNVEWQVRNRQGRYVRLVGGSKTAAKSFVFRLRARRKGRWRVRVSLAAVPPYKAAASPFIAFRVRR